MPPDVEYALRRASKMSGISIAEFVRAGVRCAMQKHFEQVVKHIEDPETRDSERLKLIVYLRACRLSEIGFEVEPEHAARLAKLPSWKPFVRKHLPCHPTLRTAKTAKKIG
jgi:hypothetical protein